METKQLKEQSVIICLHPCTKLCEQSKDFKLSIRSGAGFLPWQFITRPHREAVCDVWDWMQFMSADILLKMVMHYSFVVQSNTWRCWVILSRPINYLPKRKIVVILNNKTLCGGTQQHHWSQSSWQREAGATAATNSYFILNHFVYTMWKMLITTSQRDVFKCPKLRLYIYCHKWQRKAKENPHMWKEEAIF